MSGFGPKATDVAARIGDGYINTAPDDELVKRFKDASGGKPAQAGAKVAFARHRRRAGSTPTGCGRTPGLPGEMAQVLPTPEHFEQASELVTLESTRDSVVAGNDPDAAPRADQVVRRRGVRRALRGQHGSALRGHDRLLRRAGPPPGPPGLTPAPEAGGPSGRRLLLRRGLAALRPAFLFWAVVPLASCAALAGLLTPVLRRVGELAILVARSFESPCP